MVYINLLPVREIKQRLRARKLFFVFIGAVLSFLLMLALAGFWQKSRVSGLQAAVTMLQQEKQRYSTRLKEIKELEKKKKQLETQIGIIRKLKKKSSQTVHILDEIANVIPNDRMWLTSLSQQGNVLQLQGMALDNRTIAQFMDDLKKSSYIDTVSLSSTALKQYAGKNLKSFSLSCTTTVPGARKQEKAAKPSKQGEAH